MSQQCGCGNCESAWFEQGWRCSNAVHGHTNAGAVSEDKGPQIGVAEMKGDAMQISVPRHVVGSLLGKGGKTVQWLQEETKCRIQLHDEVNRNGCEKASRLVTIRSKSSIPSDRETSLELCAYAVEALCAEPDVQLEQVLCNGKNQLKERQGLILLQEQQEKEAQIEEQHEGAVRQLMRRIGDLFGETAIRDALSKEHWYVDEAEERLLHEGHRVPTPAYPSMSMSQTKSKLPEAVLEPIPQSLQRKDEPAPSRAVMLMRAACEQARSQDAEHQTGQHKGRIVFRGDLVKDEPGCNHQTTNCSRSSRFSAANIARRATTARRC